VELFTVKLLALTPLNLTSVAPVKLVPVMVTTVPVTPPVGVKLVIADAPVWDMLQKPPVNLAGAASAVVVPGTQFCWIRNFLLPRVMLYW
jgi:hypothetical protein